MTLLPSIQPAAPQIQRVFDGNQEANKVMEKSRVHKEVHATSGLSLPRSMWQRRSHICFLLTTLPSFLYPLHLQTPSPLISPCPVSLCIFTSSTLSRKRRARHLNRESRRLRSPCGELLVPPSISSAVCSLRNENQLSGRVLDKQQHRANAHIHNICTCFHEDTHTHRVV